MLFSKSTVAAACWLSFFVFESAIATETVTAEFETQVMLSSGDGAHPLKRHNEFLLLEGHKIREKYHSPLPYTYIKEEDLPVRIVLDLHDIGLRLFETIHTFGRESDIDFC